MEIGLSAPPREDPIEVLLARASVRVSGNSTGSGFFVAAGQVLTCAHVVGKDRKPGDAGCTIARLDGVSQPAELAAIDIASDLALLTTAAEDDDVVVALDDDALLSDALLLYGFPKAVATTRTLHYEGGEGPPGPGRLKHLVKGGQVVGGFSGGPVLNLRTLCAIGVMVETRDDRIDLGGYAVPVARIAAALPRAAAMIEAGREDAARRAWTEAQAARRRRIELRLDEASGKALALPGAAAIDRFIAQYRKQSFGGRHREFAALDSWLDDPQAPPYRLIAAPAGRGKSALVVNWLAGLAARSAALRLVFVPISLRYELAGESDVLRALAARLAAARDETAATIGNEPLVLRDAVAGMLSRPPPEGAQILVAVDGLDEAVGWSVPRELLPARLPPGVRVLLTARSTAGRDARGWREALDLGDERMCVAADLDNLSRDDVAQLVRQRWPDYVGDVEKVIDALIGASDGDTLLVSLYADEFAADPAGLLVLAREPLRDRVKGGLERYFDRWWSEQERSWGVRFARLESCVRLIFNLLATALAPIERGSLLAVARRLDPELDGDTLDSALGTLHRFVAGQGDSYVLAHPRFAEYRLAKLERDGAAARYQTAFAAWADEELAAEHGPVDRYLVRHWADHLERDLTAPERYRVLCTPRWQIAWDGFGDDESGLGRDLARAFARFIAAAEQTPTPPLACLGDAWVAGFHACRRRSYLERLDPQIAAPLLRHGVWSARRALSLVATTGRNVRRAAALAALVPLLPAELLREAERVLAALDIYDKHHLAPAWAALVRRIEAEDGRPAALVLARNRPRGAMRAATLLALAADAGKVDECSRLAVAAAAEQAAMNPVEQTEFPAIVAALLGAPVVGDRLDATGRESAIAATLAAHEYRGSLRDLTRDANIRALATTLRHALVWSTGAEAHELVERALTMLRGNASVLRGQILLDLAPFIAPDQIDGALAAIGGDDDREHLLAALSPRMTPDQRTQHAATLGEFAKRLAPDGYRPRHVASLRALAEAGFAPVILDAAVAQIRAASADDDAIAIASERAGENEVRAAIREIRDHMGCAFTAPHSALGPLLARLAGFGAQQGVDALLEAERLDDTLLRRAAQLGVGRRVGALDHFSELSAPLLEAVSSPSSRQRRWTLRCLDMTPFTLAAGAAEIFLRRAADGEAVAFILRHIEAVAADNSSVGLAAARLEADQPEDEFFDEQRLRDLLATGERLESHLALNGARIARALRRWPRQAAERAGAELFEALAAHGGARVLRPTTIGELAFVMPRVAFEGLDIQALGGRSSTDRTEVFAALGARLVVLGDVAAGVHWLQTAPYSDDVAVHIADSMRWAEPPGLVPLLDHALQRLAHRDDTDLAVEPLAGRWASLPEATARTLLNRWLVHIKGCTPTEVFAQLPNFIAGLERLGGQTALSRIAELL